MVLQLAEAWDLWSDTYDSEPNPLLELEASSLREHLDQLEGCMVLDVACGTGRWAEYARSSGARVIAVDLSPGMLAKAAHRPALSGSLVRADAGRLPIPDHSADIALCSFAISYLPSLGAAARELVRITRPGGRILVSDMHPAANHAGWKRSFRRSESTYELEHGSYTTEQLTKAFAGAGASIDRTLELHFGDEQRETFLKAGKERAFADVCRIPAVWIGMWTKR